MDISKLTSLFEKAVIEEKSLRVVGKLLPHRSSLSLNFKPGEWDGNYLTTHLLRLERSFYHLNKLKPANEASINITDIGTHFCYHPEIKKTFPQANFHYTDDFFDLERNCLLDSKDESFDIVLLWEVIEHFYIDPMHALSEINRILKPGGLLFLTTPNLASWDCLLRALNGETPSLHYRYEPNEPEGRRHVHEFVPRTIDQLLECAGFSSKIWTENVFHEGYSPRALEYLEAIGVDSENLGDTIFIFATKKSNVNVRYPNFIYDI